MLNSAHWTNTFSIYRTSGAMESGVGSDFSRFCVSFSR